MEKRPITLKTLFDEAKKILSVSPKDVKSFNQRLHIVSESPTIETAGGIVFDWAFDEAPLKFYMYEDDNWVELFVLWD